jgi:hypothetical protein
VKGKKMILYGNMKYKNIGKVCEKMWRNSDRIKQNKAFQAKMHKTK